MTKTKTFLQDATSPQKRRRIVSEIAPKTPPQDHTPLQVGVSPLMHTKTKLDAVKNTSVLQGCRVVVDEHVRELVKSDLNVFQKNYTFVDAAAKGEWTPQDLVNARSRVDAKHCFLAHFGAVLERVDFHFKEKSEQCKLNFSNIYDLDASRSIRVSRDIANEIGFREFYLETIITIAFDNMPRLYEFGITADGHFYSVLDRLAKTKVEADELGKKLELSLREYNLVVSPASASESDLWMTDTHGIVKRTECMLSYFDFE